MKLIVPLAYRYIFYTLSTFNFAEVMVATWTGQWSRLFLAWLVKISISRLVPSHPKLLLFVCIITWKRKSKDCEKELFWDVCVSASWKQKQPRTRLGSPKLCFYLCIYTDRLWRIFRKENKQGSPSPLLPPPNLSTQGRNNPGSRNLPQGVCRTGQLA